MTAVPVRGTVPVGTYRKLVRFADELNVPVGDVVGAAVVKLVHTEQPATPATHGLLRQFTVCLPPNQVKWADTAAAQQQTSRASVIRHSIDRVIGGVEPVKVRHDWRADGKKVVTPVRVTLTAYEWVKTEARRRGWPVSHYVAGAIEAARTAAQTETRVEA